MPCGEKSCVRSAPFGVVYSAAGCEVSGNGSTEGSHAGRGRGNLPIGLKLLGKALKKHLVGDGAVGDRWHLWFYEMTVGHP